MSNMTETNKPMSIHSPEFWKLATSSKFRFMKMADRKQCELVQHIDAHTATAVAEAVKAEREKWIDATTGFDDEGDKVCNVCHWWCQPDEEIIHTDDCPAKEESE